MRSYYRIMLGRKSMYADQCHSGGFIGGDFGIQEDLSRNLPDEWRAFNKHYIPIWMAAHPDKSKIAAGLSCGYLWTISKGIQKGDVILSPNGEGAYYVGSVTSDYYYSPGEILQHRRKVQWTDKLIGRASMSEALRNSSGSIGTVSDVSDYREEIDKLMGGAVTPTLISTDADVEDPSAFAMEKHLEDFLVQNWAQTDLAKDYDIFQEDGEMVGQQYQTDTGPIDILAISKDRKELLVLELKKGRASDAVVGQTARYMGYVQQELAEDGQNVRGLIIALNDDQRLRRALVAVPNISFYRYQVSFRLVKA